MHYSKGEAIVYLIFTTIFVLVMIVFIVKILFSMQKRQWRFNENLSDAKTNYERELYKVQLEIQEQTYLEIGREIHDNVGQELSLAKLGLSMLDLDKKDETKDGIAETSDILEKALNDLRHMSRSMNAANLKMGGLKKSIETQVEYIKRAGKFSIQMELIGQTITLTDKKEIFLFRIVQEALNNVIRHSKATKICISLDYKLTELELQIRDNGKGFIISDNSKPNNINGLYNMEHRAKIIGAEYKLISQIGQGTSVIVNTPY